MEPSGSVQFDIYVGHKEPGEATWPDPVTLQARQDCVRRIAAEAFGSQGATSYDAGPLQQLRGERARFVREARNEIQQWASAARSEVWSNNDVGIYGGEQEPASVLTTTASNMRDMVAVREAIERLRSAVSSILTELRQEAVAVRATIWWFGHSSSPIPALHSSPQFLPLDIVYKPEQIVYPTFERFIGRLVFKHRVVVLGPWSGQDRTIATYSADWSDNPLFLPNFDWSFGDEAVSGYVMDNMLQRCPWLAQHEEVKLTSLDDYGDEIKRTGSGSKASQYGSWGNYLSLYHVLEVPEIAERAPASLNYHANRNEAGEERIHEIRFMTVDELLRHQPTFDKNRECLDHLSRAIGDRLRLDIATK